MFIKDLLLISAGGILGTCSRYLVFIYTDSFGEKIFPWIKIFPLGTLLVNSFGCLAAGFLWAMFSSLGFIKSYRLFCFVGFLGAFTTFSAYSLDTVSLFFEGKFKLGILNILLNNILSLVFVILGFWTARTLFFKIN